MTSKEELVEQILNEDMQVDIPPQEAEALRADMLQLSMSELLDAQQQVRRVVKKLNIQFGG